MPHSFTGLLSNCPGHKQLLNIGALLIIGFDVGWCNARKSISICSRQFGSAFSCLACIDFCRVVLDRRPRQSIAQLCTRLYWRSVPEKILSKKPRSHGQASWAGGGRSHQCSCRGVAIGVAARAFDITRDALVGGMHAVEKILRWQK